MVATGGIDGVSPAPESGAWCGTVNVLLANLRDALSALIPVAERARISWREGEAYDDWDGLASFVYEIIVGRTIAADANVGPGMLPLAPYDMRLPSYVENSNFVVVTQDGSALFFNKLLAGEGDFAAAETLPARLDGRLHDADPVVLPIDSVEWKLLRRRSDGSTELFERVTAES